MLLQDNCKEHHELSQMAFLLLRVFLAKYLSNLLLNFGTILMCMAINEYKLKLMLEHEAFS